jgi:hypothetical protein
VPPDELAVPAQQGIWLDEQRTHTRQQLAKCSQDDPVSRLQLRPRHLTAQHLQLVPQQQDLHLLPLLRATEQEEQLEEAAQKPIGEAKALKQQRSSTHVRTLGPTPGLRFGHSEARLQDP